MATNKTYKASVNGTEYQVELTGNISEARLNGMETAVDWSESGAGKAHVIRDNKSYDVELVSADPENKLLRMKVNGRDYEVVLKDRYDELLHSLGMDKTMSAKVNEMKAPMPGLVLDVRVSEGQMVSKGDALVVLEAMKMENILKSPADVKVKKIIAKKGSAVEKNEVLVLFE